MKKCLICVLIILCAVVWYAPCKKIAEAENISTFFVGNMEINQELASSDKTKKVQIASLTKMFTALVVVDKIENKDYSLDSYVEISENASETEASKLGMKVGEFYTVENLLNAMLIKSANDCAVALSEFTSGSEKEFVKLINLKAIELGLRNTMLSSASGLPAPNQFSTAKDLYVVAKEFFNNRFLCDIVSKKTETIIDKSGNKKVIYSTNSLLSKGIIGKTGYTPEAGYCFCGFKENNGAKIISVVLGANTPYERFNTAETLINNAFNSHTRVKVCNSEEAQKTCLKLSNQNEICGYPESNYYVLVSNKNKEDIVLNVQMYKRVYAPIKEGEKIGEMQIVVNGKVLKTINIVTKENYSRISLLDATKKVIKNLQFS